MVNADAFDRSHAHSLPPPEPQISRRVGHKIENFDKSCVLQGVNVKLWIYLQYIHRLVVCYDICVKKQILLES